MNSRPLLSGSIIAVVTVPLNVTIPAGQTSVTFPVTAIDDSDADGTQFATVTASAPDNNDESFDLTITDDQPTLELLQATIPVGGSPKRFARLRVE